MSPWVSGGIGLTILVAAIVCRKSKRLRNFSSAAFVSAGFFLLYTLLAAYQAGAAG